MITLLNRNGEQMTIILLMKLKWHLKQLLKNPCRSGLVESQKQCQNKNPTANRVCEGHSDEVTLKCTCTAPNPFLGCRAAQTSR